MLLQILAEIAESSQKIIERYNIGKGSRVKFLNDKKVHYVERVAEDGTTLIVIYEPTQRVYRKQISRLLEVNGRIVKHG